MNMARLWSTHKIISFNRKGFVLPLVLVILALLVSGAGFFLAQGNKELEANVMNRDYEFCILTAKNAMAVVQSAIEDDLNYMGTEGMEEDENGGYYSVKITWVSETQRLVEIESHYNEYTKKFMAELDLVKNSAAFNKAKISQFKWRMVV
ncbi:hypothetical protein AKG39_12505 [Acetobacterium bakii]|uniref:Uncharacterized protein n=1 Tax=Acetobacterium bakii TaxID=52689 RepID=A0A0L6TYU2_9FIRM|nr:hypothetical protein AKG39_12505 [Acetobacterium bakii]